MLVLDLAPTRARCLLPNSTRLFILLTLSSPRTSAPHRASALSMRRAHIATRPHRSHARRRARSGPHTSLGGEKPTVEQLVNSEGPLKLTLSVDTAPLNLLHGLCALMWVRPKDAPLHIDLTRCKVGAEGLSALARGLSPALASLTLDGSDITNKGGNFAGVRRLCQALGEGCAPELAELRCVASARSLAACPRFDSWTRRTRALLP